MMIEKLQEISESLYKKYGMTDEVLELQILINEYRNGMDITDEKLILNDEYVQ